MEAFIKRNDSVATTLITHDEINIPKDEISVPCRRIIPRRNDKSFAVNFCKSNSAPASRKTEKHEKMNTAHSEAKKRKNCKCYSCVQQK